jgi:hypothetical protein
MRGGDGGALRFQGIARSGHEVNAVELQLLRRRLSHSQMSQVEGIKCPSKKRYPTPFANHGGKLVDSPPFGNARMQVNAVARRSRSRQLA